MPSGNVELADRILVLGGAGMLGHRVLASGVATSSCDVVITTVRRPSSAEGLRAFCQFAEVVVQDLPDAPSVAALLDRTNPTVVINCIGCVKQREGAVTAEEMDWTNGELPQELARLSNARGFRLLLFSTDCVFSGSRGFYDPTDIPDATDQYGRSKIRGEVTDQPNVLTIRTSLIGRELQTRQGLVEWFLSQTGDVLAYSNAVFSGVTTQVMARFVRSIVGGHRHLDGLVQIASSPIRKIDLLRLLRHRYGRFDTTLQCDPTVHCDRTLNGRQFVERTGMDCPGWPKMIDDMAMAESQYFGRAA